MANSSATHRDSLPVNAPVLPLKDALTAEAGASRPLIRLRRSAAGDFAELVTVLLPALVVIGLAAKYSGFIGNAIAANPALNYTILTVLLVGILSMGHAAWFCLQQRKAVVSWFDSQSSLASAQTWREKYGFSLVGEALKRMFEHKAGKDAEGLVQAVEHEVVAVSHGMDQRMELAGYLVGGMVALGLLGTFIGLLETLASISSLVTGVMAGLNNNGAVETAITTMVGQLRGPLNSMATAFSASMFGVTGSVVLGLMMVLVRRRTGTFTEKFRDDVHDHANATIIRYGLMDENKITIGFLRQHLGAVVDSLTRQAGYFEVAATESTRTEARIATAVESVDRVALVYGDLANRLLAIDGMIAQMRELGTVAVQQLESSKGIESSLQNLNGISEVSQHHLVALGGHLEQLRRESTESATSLETVTIKNAEATQLVVAEVVEDLSKVLQASIWELAQRMDPLVDLQSGLQVIESLLAQANDEVSKRDERSVQANAKLTSTMQVLRDTVASLTERQEADLLQCLARVERHLVDIKGVGSSSESLLKAVVQKASESSSVLGRHTSLLDGMRTALESRRHQPPQKEWGLGATHANGMTKPGAVAE